MIRTLKILTILTILHAAGFYGHVPVESMPMMNGYPEQRSVMIKNGRMDNTSDHSTLLLQKMAQGKLSENEQKEMAKLIKGNELGGGVWMMPAMSSEMMQSCISEMKGLKKTGIFLLISYSITSLLLWIFLILGSVALWNRRKPLKLVNPHFSIASPAS